MFKKITLCSSGQDSALTIGEFAEALLFYQNVHLVLDYSTLTNFIEHIGIEKLLALLSRPNITAVYCEESLGTETQKIGVTEAHKFVAITIIGDKEIGKLTNRKKRIEFILQKRGHGKRAAAKLADQFLGKP